MEIKYHRQVTYEYARDLYNAKVGAILREQSIKQELAGELVKAGAVGLTGIGLLTGGATAIVVGGVSILLTLADDDPTSPSALSAPSTAELKDAPFEVGLYWKKVVSDALIHEKHTFDGRDYEGYAFGPTIIDLVSVNQKEAQVAVPPSVQPQPGVPDADQVAVPPSVQPSPDTQDAGQPGVASPDLPVSSSLGGALTDYAQGMDSGESTQLGHVGGGAASLDLPTTDPGDAVGDNGASSDPPVSSPFGGTLADYAASLEPDENGPSRGLAGPPSWDHPPVGSGEPFVPEDAPPVDDHAAPFWWL